MDLLCNISYLLVQTANEKKLTILYLLLFLMFLILLFIDARTKKEYTGPKIVKNTIIFLLFAVGIILVVLYFIQ